MAAESGGRAETPLETATGAAKSGRSADTPQETDASGGWGCRIRRA